MQPLTPARGAVFADARGGGRTLRVSRHPEAGVVVLSLWRGSVCSGSFRLREDEIEPFLRAMGAITGDTIALASEI